MFIFLDTETTGTEPDDRLCQIAYKAGDGPPVSGLFNPGKNISIDAMAVHLLLAKIRSSVFASVGRVIDACYKICR